MIEIKKNGENLELSFDSYVKRHNLSILRQALPKDDPDNLYNYLKNSSVLMEANLTPEDFDVYSPMHTPTIEKTDPVAFEFHNLTTGHCYVDYIPRVGMTEADGYTKTPLYK